MHELYSYLLKFIRCRCNFTDTSQNFYLWIEKHNNLLNRIVLNDLKYATIFAGIFTFSLSIFSQNYYINYIKKIIFRKLNT